MVKKEGWVNFWSELKGRKEREEETEKGREEKGWQDEPKEYGNNQWQKEFRIARID